MLAGSQMKSSGTSNTLATSLGSGEATNAPPAT